MYKLTTHAKKELEKRMAEAAKVIERDGLGLVELSNLDTNNAQYSVSIFNAWIDYGGDHVKGLKHTGTLEDAIKKAEDKFMKINKRSDVQGSYRVYLNIGPSFCLVPEKYYKEMKFKYRKEDL